MGKVRAALEEGHNLIDALRHIREQGHAHAHEHAVPANKVHAHERAVRARTMCSSTGLPGCRSRRGGL
eukprot:3828396-Prymnesium_polylepis.1